MRNRAPHLATLGGRWILLFLLLLFLPLQAPGCSLAFPGGKPTASPGGRPSPAGRGLRDFRVAFHCHSHLSHDSKVPFDRIAACAGRLGFNAVILNDHYEPPNIARAPHGMWDGVLFIPGVELRPRLPEKSSEGQGSLLVFGIERDFDRGKPSRGLIEELRSGGALAAAGHCEEFPDLQEFNFDCFEVYNLHAQIKEAPRIDLGLRLLFTFPDPFFEDTIDPSREVLDLYDRELRRGRRLAALAGHDAHENTRILGCTIGTYPQILRLFSNHVLAPELTSPSILDALRRGRAYVSFDFLGDGSGFAAAYGPEPQTPGPSCPSGGGILQMDGTILGEEALYRPEWALQVFCPEAGRINVLRDGSPWAEERGQRFSRRLPGPGIYRVEVDREDRMGRERTWIISSPIYVRGPAEPSSAKGGNRAW